MRNWLILFLLSFCLSSCLKPGGLYKGEDPDNKDVPDTDNLYLYPFAEEVREVTARIVVRTKSDINPELLKPEIPPLKYNKSWLFTLTQDDCKHAAFCYTWAAINGRPVSKSYYYDNKQYLAGDLPPDIRDLGKTLGCTDGAGNEVRFHFTTTLYPELSLMNEKTVVKPGYSGDYYRFYMKKGLVWSNVIEMVNWETGIAFHDVLADNVNDPASILEHYRIAQESILKHLPGRGCKMLAEPNGNKNYVTAAMNYAPIQVMTAQNGGTVLLCPFKVEDDLHKKLLYRMVGEPAQVKQAVQRQLAREKNEREAVCVGVHSTDGNWVDFLLWLNDNYGKDGDDSMWFPSLEEYYEYNYFRQYSTIQKSVEGSDIVLTLNMPGGEYFYYPSVTLNLPGISHEDIIEITAGDEVTGLSYAAYPEGVMINVDCRKFLYDHAVHYVKEYEAQKTAVRQRDAAYWVNRLKPSAEKDALLLRIK